MFTDTFHVDQVVEQEQPRYDSPSAFDDSVTALGFSDPRYDGSFLHDAEETPESQPTRYDRTEEFATSLVNALQQKGSIGITLRGTITEGRGSDGTSHFYTATGIFTGRDWVYKDGRGPFVIEHSESGTSEAQLDLRNYRDNGPEILAESLTRNSKGVYSATPNGLDVRISKKR